MDWEEYVYPSCHRGFSQGYAQQYFMGLLNYVQINDRLALSGAIGRLSGGKMSREVRWIGKNTFIRVVIEDFPKVTPSSTLWGY